MTIYTKTVTPGISKIFSLKDIEIYILNDFGKNGPLFRNSIDFIERKKRQASRQIDSLFNQGYFYLVEKKPYRNAEKFTKLFGLSLKGFFPSLSGQKIDENYIFKKFVELFPDDLKILVKEFLILCVLEFVLYHKSIGLKIDGIYNLPKYVKEIIYDFDLIVNKHDKLLLEKIHNDMIIIDEIRDIIHDYETYDGEDDFEKSFMENELEINHSTNEHIKYEFLINFWPYVLDELGKGNNIESELENISDGVPPFGLSEYKEDFKEFIHKKSSMIIKQWQLRKLNFIPDSLSFSM